MKDPDIDNSASNAFVQRFYSLFNGINFALRCSNNSPQKIAAKICTMWVTSCWFQ